MHIISSKNAAVTILSGIGYLIQVSYCGVHHLHDGLINIFFICDALTFSKMRLAVIENIAECDRIQPTRAILAQDDLNESFSQYLHIIFI